jgi:hypothetical protein
MKDTFNSFINRIENLKLELERAKQSWWYLRL